MELTSEVKTDEITARLSGAFDYKFDGKTSFDPPKIIVPEDFAIGLVVGPSGTGKTSALRLIGETSRAEWNPEMAVCSHFASADDAIDRLGAVGLNSIPAWMKPYHVLSNGEKFRADLARVINTGAIVDEFTSVVDRNVAKSCSFAISRYVRKSGIRRIIFATCHYDVADWLQPDWIYDTAARDFLARGWERRPDIVVTLSPCDPSAWSMFSSHHYLDSNINRSSRCWIAEWDGTPIGFASVISFPSGSLKNAWREHRTVVLPEFQGMGIGVRISDAVGMMVKAWGGRYFSKTANFRMGGYRNSSPLWRPTSKNGKSRADYNHDRETKESGYKDRHINRVCWSHEFVGGAV